MISKSLACVENKEPVGVAEICTTSGLLFTTHEELNRIENILLDAGLLRKN